jgi:hypothetical protein
MQKSYIDILPNELQEKIYQYVTASNQTILLKELDYEIKQLHINCFKVPNTIYGNLLSNVDNILSRHQQLFNRIKKEWLDCQIEQESLSLQMISMNITIITALSCSYYSSFNTIGILNCLSYQELLHFKRFLIVTIKNIYES